MNRSTPGLPIHHQLPEFTQTHIHWVSDAIQHLILCRPLFLLPPIPPSIRVFSSESTLRMRWPKYWSFNFNIIPRGGWCLLNKILLKTWFSSTFLGFNTYSLISTQIVIINFHESQLSSKFPLSLQQLFIHICVHACTHTHTHTP